jgi:hypothetical protein
LSNEEQVVLRAAGAALTLLSAFKARVKNLLKKGGRIMKKSLLIKQGPSHLLCTLYGLASSDFAAAGASLARHAKSSFG